MGGLKFLPFVRDSKNAPVDNTKVTKPAAVAAPSPVPAVAPSPSPVATAEVDPIVASILAKGEEIRVLKAAKADKETIKTHVDELLNLKIQYKEKFGAEYDAKPSNASKSAPKKEALKPKEVKPVETKPVVEAPQVQKPTYTSPAPVRKVYNELALNDLIVDGAVDLNKLESKLSFYSFVGGYLKSEADDQVFAMVKDTPINSSFVNVNRWYRNYASFKQIGLIL